MAMYKACIMCLALLLFTHVSSSHSQWTAEDEEGLETSLELDEYDFDDACKLLDDPDNENDVKLVKTLVEDQRAKAFGYAGHKLDEYPARKKDIARKLEVASKPGDALLSEHDHAKLLDFTADVSKSLTNKSIECEKLSAITSLTSMNSACDLTFRDPGQLLTSWNQSLSADIQTSYPEILGLVSKAALANGYPDVQSYWLMLSELDSNGYQTAKELWQEVRPLYEKMHLWVATKLEQNYGPFDGKEGRLPSYLLGSRLGTDWTPLAELMLTNQCKDVYQHIRSVLEEEEVAGKLLYQKTEKMIDLLNVDKLKESFWKESNFNHSCPAIIVDNCRATPRVDACSTPSWSEYLHAHELTMTNVQSQMASTSDHASSYLLRNANRYSAIDSSLAGLATLLASNRHYLAQTGLISPANQDECLPVVIGALMALKTLPKLPYYLAADLARLEALRTNSTHRIAAIWNDILASSDMQEWQSQGQANQRMEYWAFLEDLHISSNQPYISQFYGVFLQFQLYEEMLMRDEAISENNQRFIHSRREFSTLMEMGRSQRWPELLRDTFQIENITAAHLLRFFSLFEASLPQLSKTTAPKSPPKATAPKIAAAQMVPEVSTLAAETILPEVLPTDSRQDQVAKDPVAKDPVAKGSTETSVVTTETPAEKGPGIGDILLVVCLIIGAIAIIAVIINYGRKRIKKLHEYRRPTNQPA